MKKIKIWFQYLFYKRTEFVFPLLLLEGNDYGGRILKIEEYKIRSDFFGIPYMSKEINTYWNPLKKFISREAVPHALEFGNNNSDYITVWFKIKSNEIVNPRDIRIIGKMKWNSPKISVLNNIFSNVQRN